MLALPESIHSNQCLIGKVNSRNLIIQNMKKMVKTTGMALMLFMAGALTLTAQQYAKGMRMDTARMHRIMMQPGHMQMNSDSMPIHSMRGMGHGMMKPGMGGMGRGMMQPGMGGMNRDRMMGGMCQCPMMQNMMQQRSGMQQRGLGRGPGMQGMMHQRMIMESIPNLTDKQKKDIAVMRIDQQTEMQKFRDDMQSKLMTIRETQRASIEKLLTPDQKKWLDENSPKPEAPQKPQSAQAKSK
jgi:hypothetical protein